MASPLVGQKLLHYQLLEKIGEGGMGVVYKARDTHLDRFVAIKLLPPDKVADPTRRSRFVQEAKAASALRHPNIVTIHDIASDDGHDFIVMEYVDGKTLDQMIGRRGLKLNHAVRYAIQVADALARAHAAGIVHRDIKPSNIIVDGHGQVKVLDFGLAKLTEPVPPDDESTRTMRPVTEDGKVVGTAAYMSPEQAEGRQVDTRSDVFSFGATLYEMVTGRRPFQGDSALSTMAAIINTDPAPVGDDVPQELRRIVMRCLRKDPDRRWQSMADLRVALDDFREDSESGTLPAQPHRKRSTFLLVALPVLLVVVAAVWYALTRSGDPSTETYKVVPLTTYPGRQQSPTFSPDGTQLAFSWCRVQGCAIYIKQIGVEEPYRLSKPPDNAHSPEWSPDGAYIAFQRIVEAPEPRWQYVVVPQRGGAERIIADFPKPRPVSLIHGSRNIAWAPDSKTVIVTGSENARATSSLFEATVVGGPARKLIDAPPEQAIGDPALSRDGKHLAYCIARSDLHADLYVSSIAQGAVMSSVRLAKELTQIAAPAWVPGTDDIVFSAVENESERALWRTQADPKSVPVRLPVPAESTASFAISGSGRMSWVRAVGRDADVFRIKASTRGEFGEPETFISSTALEIEPKFSPDGTKIALNSYRSGTSQIWLFDSDGSNPLSLTADGPVNSRRPRWSPDGQSIVFYSSVGPSVNVYVVSASGGRARPLTHERTRSVNPEWSCDGKHVYFLKDAAIWRVPISGGAAVVIQETDGSAGETPDCRYFWYMTGWPDRYSLHRVLLPSGEPELFADGLHPTGGFAIFSDGIYYISKSPSDHGFPLLFKAPGGETRELARVPSPFWGLTVSPDRKTILYASQKPGDSNLMMIENFR